MLGGMVPTVSRVFNVQVVRTKYIQETQAAWDALQTPSRPQAAQASPRAFATQGQTGPMVVHVGNVVLDSIFQHGLTTSCSKKNPLLFWTLWTGTCRHRALTACVLGQLVVVTLGPGKLTLLAKALLALALSLEMVPTLQCLMLEEIQPHVYNGVPDQFPHLYEALAVARWVSIIISTN